MFSAAAGTTCATQMAYSAESPKSVVIQDGRRHACCDWPIAAAGVPLENNNTRPTDGGRRIRVVAPLVARYECAAYPLESCFSRRCRVTTEGTGSFLMARWWARELSTVEDPISLEPLRVLAYPPFQCKADPELAHRTDSDYFDGHVLSMYLVSTANFVHPISRRDLTREECVALDHYCTLHGLCGAHVTHVFDSAGSSKDATAVAMMQAQAGDVLQSLFGRQAERRNRRGSLEPRPARPAGEAGLVVVDDDLRPSHATAVDVDDEQPPLEEAFPALTSPGGTLPGTSSSSLSSSSCTWTSSSSSAQHLQPPPPPPPEAQPPTAEERERESRARLMRERQAWAAAAVAAELKAVVEASAQVAAAASAADAARAEARAWELDVARSERYQASVAAKAAAAAEAAREEAAAASRELHRAAAAGEASLVSTLLKRGWDPTRRHPEYGERVAYEVASNEEVRQAFRQYRCGHMGAWDWAMARVPIRSEVEEAQAEEEARQRAREKKKVAERSRKERRKEDAAAREHAIEAARLAASAEDEDALGSALDDAERLGCEPGDLKEFAEKLAALNDPEARQRRERDRRVEAVQQRLGGLTTAQAGLIRGDNVARRAVRSSDASEADDEVRVDTAVGDRHPYDVQGAAYKVTLIYKGRSEEVTMGGDTPISELFSEASRVLELPEESFSLKLILKGKTLHRSDALTSDVLGSGSSRSTVKLMVMASARDAVDAVQVATCTSDPKVASFAAEHGSRKAGVTITKGVRQGKMKK